MAGTLKVLLGTNGSEGHFVRRISPARRGNKCRCGGRVDKRYQLHSPGA